MKKQVNISGQGINHTFEINDEVYALVQYGEEYNGCMTICKVDKKFSQGCMEVSFCCYENANSHFVDRDKAIEIIIENAKEWGRREIFMP